MSEKLIRCQTLSAGRKYRKLEDHWNGCTKCALSTNRTNIVHARGTVPAKFLFIGEAPGRDEDRTGSPFVGRSGTLLDFWIHQVSECLLAEYPDWDRKKLARFFSWGIINTVGCIPLRDKMSLFVSPSGTNAEVVSGISQPQPDEQKACLDRYYELIKMFNPWGVILLGRIASEHANRYLRPQFTGPVLRIHHPAYVLRRGGKQSQESTTAIEFLLDFVKFVNTPSEESNDLETPH